MRSHSVPLLAFLLAGCALWRPMSDLLVQHGQLAPQMFLVTVMVVPDADVPSACDARPAAKPLACTRNVTVSYQDSTVVLSRLVFSRSMGLDRRAAVTYAHEACHALAAAQKITDPCHQ